MQAHGAPSEPGLSLGGLRGGETSDSELETLVSDGEDEAEDEVDQADQEEEDRSRGIIGIDVGTTFSGLSFQCMLSAQLKHLQPYLLS